jgi:hypothetical protein
MLDEHLPGSLPITLAADRGHHTRDFVAALRERNVTPHIAMIEHQRPSIDGRTTRHHGYKISQRIRKRVEENLRLDEDGRSLSKTRFKGVQRTDFASRLVGAAYNRRIRRVAACGCGSAR